MKKLIATLLALMPLCVSAQQIHMDFKETSFSDALTKIARKSKDYRVHFVFNELEDFTVTEQVSANSAPEAIHQIIGFYPIKMTVDSTNIFVECFQKADNKLIGRVIDREGLPLEYANVALYHAEDTCFITGGVSNANGDFVIPCNEQEVRVKVSYVGYITAEKRVAVGEIGNITLMEDNKMLKNVTVTGARVVTLPDRQVLIPSKNAVSHSGDAYQLLNNMSVEGILVDPVQRKISKLGGGEVQVRINDVQATNADLMSLQPDEVIRVENITNPGVRYGEKELGAVLNFVVRRRYAGQVAGIGTQQALTTGFNNSDAYFKYNYKLSEFSLSYNFGYRKYDKRWLDETATIMFPDGTKHERNYIGEYTPFKYHDHYIQLGYNLSDPDKYTLNIRAILSDYISPYRGNNQIVSETGKAPVYQYNNQDLHAVKPSLDIFYSVNLPKQQKIDVNVVGTYTNTDNHYAMQQYLFDTDKETTMRQKPVHDYSYSTDAKKYSVIAEAIYTKNFEKVNLSGGLYYDLGYASNQYTGSNDLNAQLHTNDFYAFAQVQGALKKLQYQVGFGAKHIEAHENGLGYNKWVFRPQLTLQYPLAKHLNAAYTFNAFPNVPSLASLSSVRQQSSDLFADDGNPNLKPNSNYINRLRLNYWSKYVEASAQYQYAYSPDVIENSILPELQADGSYIIVRQLQNQKSFQSHQVQLNVNLKIVPDVFTVMPMAIYQHYHSKSDHYDRTFGTWTYGVRTNLMLGKWNATYTWMNAPKSYMGEMIGGGERMSDLNISYRHKNWEFGAGCLLLGYPQGYDYTQEIDSRYYKDHATNYFKDNGNMVYVSLRYQFSHGRKYKTGWRTLENSDNDSGVK